MLLQASTYFYDENGVRYELYKSSDGKALNWLFLPGGPGGDSRYLHSLVSELNLEGNVWLIDLPGNGDNGSLCDYDQWFCLFPKAIMKFDNAILVGHSFGGMFPLLFPELEHHLKALIILNSSPGLYASEAVSYASQFDLPDLTSAMLCFTQDPNQKSFEAALNACIPYYFPKETLEKGRALLSAVPFQFEAAVWWQRKMPEIDFSAIWIPQNLPTMIVGAKFDCICPFSLFANDQRFKRDNIELFYIENAGHMPWVENPERVREIFSKMSDKVAKYCE